MRILYSNVIEQNSPWGAEVAVNRALRQLGHITHCIDYRQNRRRLHRVFSVAPTCDAFLLQRGDDFPVTLVRAVAIPRFFWASELFARRPDQHAMIKCGLFEHIFVRTPECVNAIASRGWMDRERVSVLRSAFDDHAYRRSPAFIRDIDLLFVGGVTPRRQRMLATLKTRLKTASVTVASAFGREASGLYNRAKVVLNIHAEEHRDTETRVFEALGCGAFLLTERLSDENPFSNGELVQFDTLHELEAMAQYYLDHADEREAIAERGFAAAKGHTYLHRAEEVIEVMERYLRLPCEADRPVISRRRWLGMRDCSYYSTWLTRKAFRKCKVLW